MEGEGEGSWLGGQWKEKEKVLGLVVNGRRRKRFLAWWSMEDLMLGGHWNVPCLVAIGM